MQPQLRMATQTVGLSQSTNKVLRNTYMMLGLTMIPTVIGAVIGMSMNFSFMAQSPILGTVVMLAVMFGLFWGISKNRDSGVGVALLLALTFFMGIMLGPILQVALHLKNGAQLVGLAAGGTGVIFLALSTYATVSKKDFSFLGNFLFVGLILLIIASLANMFFQVPAASLAISSVAVLIFSGFILFDVSRIVQGGETNYIMATLALYLNIYNLFVNLLQLLMALSGERD
ncbi:MAG: Bax inhibitor-1/YccA family protein [Sulfurimicrobium sp.]|nr:Bax inhibitor-1/YccA family protein [Sulfurimicrobium sp.]MDP1703466.1 Bax inhibitor-1/YccA family protein [Sulfurimicrobium sp.]MDP2199258.1 Bax inhibitor-1/YccA family protein [Sulfurimicrobium sp.]MDP3689188.1 Bax inhibitor-1/YccA family protein [Sulfurimicrobium sp.]